MTVVKPILAGETNMKQILISAKQSIMHNKVQEFWQE